LVYSQSWLNPPKHDRRFGSVCFFPFCDVAQVVIIPITTIFIQIWRYAKHESRKSLAVVVIFFSDFRIRNNQFWRFTNLKQ
jgi:hypothetical protein